MKKICILLCAMLPLSISAQSWQPAKVSLTTEWGAKLNPENAWKEYPRPQMVRDQWQNLNGLWNYAILDSGQQTPSKYDGEILVPFCVESSLSGVGKSLTPKQELWYQRKFTVPADWQGKDLVLHFDAVDWSSKLWVNGKKVGEHKGGSDPFSFNITSFIQAGKEQEIVMSVWDPTDTDLQARGKQVLDPKGIWYTAVSGIWQTVWLEPVSKKYIRSFVPRPDIDKKTISFEMAAPGATAADKVMLKITQGGQKIAETTVAYNKKITLPISSPKLWSPKSPALYDVEVELQSGGNTTDKFSSYFAMRKISLGPDKSGYTRLLLNNEFVFQYGPLDQGWWPDGLLTPPSDEAMLFDMIKLKETGFNMVRKHIKVEPSRYYYHADTMGLLLWQDMPSGFAGPGPSHVKYEDKEDWKRPAESAKQFEKEWLAIMDHLDFFPCIVMWVPLNEGWGQYDTKRLAKLTKDHDPSRLVDAPSGWTDRGVGDVNDAHQYPGPGMEPPSKNKGRAIVLGEFGGLGLVIKDHIWDPNKRNWGYKTYMDGKILISEYEEMMHNLKQMVSRGLSAAVYTQTTDVEGEVNGFLTYDRKVMKIPEAHLRRLHAPLYEGPAGKVSFINMPSETAKNKYRFTKEMQGGDWATSKEIKGMAENNADIELKKGESVFAVQTIKFEELPSGLGLQLYGYGDAKIYINGKLVWQEDKIRTKRHYDDINLSDYISLMKTGENQVAVECKDATQDTKFDFFLYRIDK